MMAHRNPINTHKTAERFRERAIDVPNRKILISRLAGSEQEEDLSQPANCRGLGRVRHFRLDTSLGWPPNPLPIVPACPLPIALGITPVPDMMRAQVFQNAACAWRCWYCFVPYNLLAAKLEHSEWLTPEQLVDLYIREYNRPLIIVLSGGSPDLVPEWTVWVMEALIEANLDQSTYLWTDDNLSTTYLFDRMTPVYIDRLVRYRNYGRVCCFKGFDARSFAFNTHAASSDYDQQFQIMGRLLKLGLDLFGYVTLTSPYTDGVSKGVNEFVDRLQALDPNLPLRVVPLQIQVFAPVQDRLQSEHERSLAVQEEAIAAWNSELNDRFEPKLRRTDIADVPLGSGR